MTTMEVTVLDTGEIPRGTAITFYDGSVPLGAPMEVAQGQSVSLTVGNTTDDVRIELMSQMGTDMVRIAEGQELYDVRIADPCLNGAGDDVELRLLIRNALIDPVHRQAPMSTSSNSSPVPTPPYQVTPSPPQSRASGSARPNPRLNGRPTRMQSPQFNTPEQQRQRAIDMEQAGNDCSSSPTHVGSKVRSPNSPSGRLSAALNTGNYLNNHGVLTAMQELLGQLVATQPDAPLDFLIERLEQASASTNGVPRFPDGPVVDLE